MLNDEKCINHPIFHELKEYIDFYNQLSYSVLYWTTLGTSRFFNIDSYLYASIQATLTSILSIAQDGKVNDAYALLRKYYDASIINIYINLYLNEHFSVENLIVEQIENWLNGKNRLPEYRIMAQFIHSSPKVMPITSLLFVDNRYKLLRDRCNDNYHYNTFDNVLLNDTHLFLSDRAQRLDQLAIDVRDVFILHLAYLFFVNGHYMMACDYRDSLECGITPEPGSQYWIAPFVQDIIDSTTKKYRPDVFAILKEQTNMLFR